VSSTAESRSQIAFGELGKLSAFVRRDFLTAWSYRMAFFTDVFNLMFQAVLFYFIGRMVNPTVLPSFGGERASYLEFVAVGIVLSAFVQLGVGRVASAMRREQTLGTLESLLLTPTSTATIQLGSVVYDLIYIPLRTALFLVIIAVGFGLDFQASGVLPAALILLLFIPFVWGLGILSAGAVLTFRQGSGGVGFVVAILTLGSGAYFPLQLFPDAIRQVAEASPIALAIEGMRDALLGGEVPAASTYGLLAGSAALSLIVGALGFRLALQRETRLGTVGLY
jgi:ABC-type polysaccharide/polyol phosphate export permease